MPYLRYTQARIPQLEHATDAVLTDFSKADAMPPPDQIVREADTAGGLPQTLPLDPIPLTTLCLLVAALMGVGLYMWVRHHRKNRDNTAATEQTRDKVAEDPRYPPEDRVNPRDFSLQQKTASSLPPIQEEAKYNEKASFQSLSRQSSVKDDRPQHGQDSQGATSDPSAVGEDLKPVQSDVKPSPSREPILQEENTRDAEDFPKPASRVPSAKDEPYDTKPDLRNTVSDPPQSPSNVVPSGQDQESPSKPPSRASTGFAHNILKNHKF